MEKKLSEFRARRMAENASKGVEGATPHCKGQTLAEPAPQTDSQHTEEVTENRRDSTQCSPRKDGGDWLLDSALGRWLASKPCFLSNLTLLKVLLWLVLLGLFVELEFGLPFFVISLFYWLYEGLRSPAAREPGELSAYSVFNPDCQPLLGSLTAEQLEGELGYRWMADRV